MGVGEHAIRCAGARVRPVGSLRARRGRMRGGKPWLVATGTGCRFSAPRGGANELNSRCISGVHFVALIASDDGERDGDQNIRRKWRGRPARRGGVRQRPCGKRQERAAALSPPCDLSRVPPPDLCPFTSLSLYSAPGFSKPFRPSQQRLAMWSVRQIKGSALQDTCCPATTTLQTS